MKFKNIAISGDIGTGKTTLAENLANKMGWKHLNAGDYFRKWHEDKEIPLAESEKVPEEVDRAFDKDFQEKMKTSAMTIFESRLAGWLARDFPEVFRILCITNFDVAMARVAKRDGISIEEASEKSRERSLALEEKFNTLYGVSDYLNPKYFNLIVDTTNLSSEETLNLVIDRANNWLTLYRKIRTAFQSTH